MIALYLVIMTGLFILFGIFFVTFGQVTVRKLRKNPETKNALGMELVNGWDIINVAQALAIPQSWAKKLKQSPLSSFYANVDLLYENTDKVDRFLAFTIYWLLMFIGLSGILLVILNWFGLIN